MSYALIGGLGISLSEMVSGVPKPTAQDVLELLQARSSAESCSSQTKSGGIDYCAGYVRSCPDREMCCSPNGKGPQNTGDFTSSNDQGQGWFNFVYQEVLGKTALRKKREDRVWKRLTEALYVQDKSVTASNNGIEEFAWDRGDLYVDPSFVQEAFEAAKNWRRIFSESRWRLEKKGVSAPFCQSDGFYSQWRIAGHWTKKRLDALALAVPIGMSPETRIQVGKVGWLSPKSHLATTYPKAVMTASLAKWFEREEALINSLAGNRLTDRYGDEPGAVHPSNRGTKNTLLLKKKGELVLPTSWFQSFIEMFRPKTFAPGLRFPSSSPDRVPIMRIPISVSRDPGGRGGRPPVDAEEVSSSMKFAALSLAVGGAALLWKFGG